jgi:uncharacterized membrane protein
LTTPPNRNPANGMPRAVLRWLLALFYLLAGVAHLAQPAPFLVIMPPWVPWPGEVVALTGLAELAGAVGLVQPWLPRLRHTAGWGLACYALAVWPANYQHFLLDQARTDAGLGLGYHVPRLAFQPVLIWAALWSAAAIDWPLGKRRGGAAAEGRR